MARARGFPARDMTHAHLPPFFDGYGGGAERNGAASQRCGSLAGAQCSAAQTEGTVEGRRSAAGSQGVSGGSAADSLCPPRAALKTRCLPAVCVGKSWETSLFGVKGLLTSVC